MFKKFIDCFRSLFRSRVRVYVYLPLTYNPDAQGIRQPIPEEDYYAVLKEIEDYLGERFTGLSSEIYTKRHIQGLYKGQEEEMRTIHIDLTLSRQDRRWFREMRDTVWRERFKQEEIYVQVLKRGKL